MAGGRRSGRVAAGVVLAAAAFAVGSPPASATAPHTVVTGTTFRTTMSTPGSVSVACSSNHVQVNGSNVGINCSTVTAFTVVGSSGADTITTTGVHSSSFGSLTGVTISSGAGNDDVTVGGASTGYGNAVNGGSGDDHLTATGDASLNGDGGADTLTGGSGYAILTGGTGKDTIHGGPGGDAIVETAGDLPDASVVGGTGSDTLFVEAGQRYFVQGRSPGGCQIVVSTPSQIGIVSGGSSIEFCAEAFSGAATAFAHEVIVDKLAQSSEISPQSPVAHTRLDVYTDGAADWNAPGKTIDKSGSAPVAYDEEGSGTFDVTLDQTWGNSDERWLHAAIRDLQDIEMSPSQVDTAAAPIHAGTITRADEAKVLTDSAAWAGLQVDRIYQEFLGRNPDAGGRSYWVGRIQGGTEVRVCRAGFMASDEFFTDSGGTDTKYVTAVYEKVLGRAPDSGGLSYWVGRLNHGDPRSTVATALITSAETEEKEVNRQFQYYVGRVASSGEEAHWYPIIRDESDGEQQLHAYLVASTGFADRAG